MGRFQGFVEKIGEGIDVDPMLAWVTKIPLADWPPATPPFTVPNAYPLVRPSIVNDPNWHDFGRQARALLDHIQGLGFPALAGKMLYDYKISTIVPEQFLGSHYDKMDETNKRWCFRVHVPILTNKRSFFILDRPYQLEAGSAYAIGVEHLHAVVNHGTTPRIHFMFETDSI